MYCGVGLAVLKNGVKAEEQIAEKAKSARRQLSKNDILEKPFFKTKRFVFFVTSKFLSYAKL